MIFSTISRFKNWMKNFVSWTFRNAQNTVKRVIILLLTACVILWIAVLLYASFYHVHVPSQSIIRSAHFKFRVCPNGVGMCSFPVANITLGVGGRAEVLGRGQRYSVALEMEVPDSVSNRDLGMFMVVMKVYDRHGHIVQESSRTASLKYQSDLLLTIQTLSWAPLYVTGFAEQKQNLRIQLFDDYLDDVYRPAVGMLIEIHSRQLELYTAELKLHATYTGIRYYMFYWPLTSACFGISFNCMWLILIALLSWYKLGDHDNNEPEDTVKWRRAIHKKEEQFDILDDDMPPPERGYIQPFTMTTSYRDAETIGEAQSQARDQLLGAGDRGRQDDFPLLRQRSRQNIDG